MSKSNILIRGKQRRARAHFEKNQLGEAETLYRQITASHRQDFEAWQMLGTICWRRGETAAAEAHFRRALELRPDEPVIQHNLACTQLAQNKREEAIAGLRRATRLKPDFLDPLLTLGNVYASGGDLEEAAACYRAGLGLQPRHPVLHNNLGNVLADQGRTDDAVASWRRALELRPDYAAAHSNLLLALNYDPRHTPEQIFHEHLAWARQHATPPDHAVTCRNVPDPEKKLRVGYVSPDFREHSVAYFIEPLLAAHDHERFEIHCYSDVARPDATTRRLQELNLRFHSIAGIPDEQVANCIRADGIDILIDLAGHTTGNRLQMFARRAAPVQVSYLGYPNTTGMAAMDYRLTDAWADPPGESESYFTETLVRLPGGFLCYRPPAGAPEVGPPPVNATGHVTFGSFNYAGKIRPEAIIAWARILAALPDARLILKSKSFTDFSTRDRFLALFTANGVDPVRIGFIGLTRDKSGHLDVYNRVDIALDTFPYNGTTTTCDTLWMGVPVVTLHGSSHAGRVGASLLSRVGLAECIATSTDDYVARAVALARDREKLAALRAQLRAIVSASSLCDARGFAAQVEGAYRQLWRAWCVNTKPGHATGAPDQHACSD